MNSYACRLSYCFWDDEGDDDVDWFAAIYFQLLSTHFRLSLRKHWRHHLFTVWLLAEWNAHYIQFHWDKKEIWDKINHSILSVHGSPVGNRCSSTSIWKKENTSNILGHFASVLKRCVWIQCKSTKCIKEMEPMCSRYSGSTLRVS